MKRQISFKFLKGRCSHKKLYEIIAVDTLAKAIEKKAKGNLYPKAINLTCQCKDQEYSLLVRLDMVEEEKNNDSSS